MTTVGMVDAAAAVVPPLVVDGIVVGSSDQLFLGEQIRFYRNHYGYKQAAIARRLGVDQSIIGLWQSDQRPVPHNRLASLAAALEIDVATLLVGVIVELKGYKRPQLSVVQPALAESTPKLPPSRYSLLWCTSSHLNLADPRLARARVKLHHHGPRPSYSGRVTIDIGDLA